MRDYRALVILWCLLAAIDRAQAGKVTIRADFPGGNVNVVKNERDAVELAPDLRGGPAWFYWHFEAEADAPGSVSFSFARPPMMAVRGPAVSHDGGRTWQWLGAEHVTLAAPPGEDKSTPQYDRFAYNFSEPGQKVRFAVAIPYLQRDLTEFLSQHEGNSLLSRSVLTHTRLGRRPVDLVQIGQPGKDKVAMLLTARHHACESMASYVLEGFLEEAMSTSPAGQTFRQEHVLYAVPLVDTDGVEQGDQGKNRVPHDHNRDYGEAPIYPEIRAIQELAEEKDIRLSLDLHCPFVRGDIHEAFHFVGLAAPHIKDNLKQWTAWLKEERPQVAMTPIDLLKDPNKPNTVNRRINSHYFGTREKAIFAVCLEVPYAQTKCPLDANMAREYGRSLLRAWARTRFLPEGSGDRGDEEPARLLAFRTAFLKSYRGQPAAAEELAHPYLAKNAAPVYRAEANNLLAQLRLFQRKHPEALRHVDAAEHEAGATALQKCTASLLRVKIVCGNPQSMPDAVEAAMIRWQTTLYPADEQHAKAMEAASEFYQRRKDYEAALSYTRRQFEHAAAYEQGKLLNRIATMLDALQRPQDAISARQEAVVLLRARLEPTPPRSIFGALMTFDLFEALVGIPTATREERDAAAALVLEHEIASAELKTKVRNKLAELQIEDSR